MIIQKIFSFVIILTALPSQCQVHAGAAAKITVHNNRLVDEYGRVRVFHGLNRVLKSYPWYPAQLLNDTHVANLAKWGFNAVRLGTMWSGLETSSFHANQTYINIMSQILEKLNKYGIYAILDMHQDALSSKFGTYDGMPLWLVESFPPAKHPYPYPFKKVTSWGLNYVTEACGEAFQNLYSNTSQALDHLAFFWQTVASTLGKYGNVLGYELINEPWPGSVIEHPSLLIPGKAGKTVLQPLYDKIANKIRKIDNTTLIFYEPVTWGMILNNQILGSGFDHVPGGDQFKDKSVFSFHYYFWALPDHSTKPYSPALKYLCDSLFMPKVIETVQQDIKRLGGAAFLTEFGECEAGSSKNTTEFQECLDMLTILDATFQSWTYWDSEFYDSHGSVILDNVKLFSRTYATAIAGAPISSSFDFTTGFYQLQFIAADMQVPTEIFVSPYHYSNGYDVVTSDGLTQKRLDESHVLIYSSKALINTDVWVVIRAKPSKN